MLTVALSMTAAAYLDPGNGNGLNSRVPGGVPGSVREAKSQIVDQTISVGQLLQGLLREELRHGSNRELAHQSC